MCRRWSSSGKVVMKHPSACSMVAQANDLGCMHKETHKDVKKFMSINCYHILPHIQSHLVHGGFSKIFKTKPSLAKQKLFAKLIVVVVAVTNKSFGSAKLLEAHKRAGWVDDEIDADIFVERESGFTFDHSRLPFLKETVIPALEHIFRISGSVTEQEYLEAGCRHSAHEAKLTTARDAMCISRWLIRAHFSRNFPSSTRS